MTLTVVNIFNTSRTTAYVVKGGADYYYIQPLEHTSLPPGVEIDYTHPVSPDLVITYTTVEGTLPPDPKSFSPAPDSLVAKGNTVASDATVFTLVLLPLGPLARLIGQPPTLTKIINQPGFILTAEDLAVVADIPIVDVAALYPPIEFNPDVGQLVVGISILEYVHVDPHDISAIVTAISLITSVPFVADYALSPTFIPAARSLTVAGVTPLIGKSFAIPAGSLLLTRFTPPLFVTSSVLALVGAVNVSGSPPNLSANLNRIPFVADALGISGTTVVASRLFIPAVNSVPITSLPPSVIFFELAQPLVGTLAATTNAPIVGNTYRIFPAVGAIGFTGFPPTLTIKLAQPSAGSAAVAGAAPTLAIIPLSKLIVPSATLLVGSGGPPVLGISYGLLVPTSPLGFTNSLPIVLTQIDIIVNSGSASIATTTGTVFVDIPKRPTPAAITLSGTIADVRLAINIQPTVGSMILVGALTIVASGDIIFVGSGNIGFNVANIVLTTIDQFGNITITYTGSLTLMPNVRNLKITSVARFAPISDDLGLIGNAPIMSGAAQGNQTVTPAAGILYDGIRTNWKPIPLVGNAYNIGAYRGNRATTGPTEFGRFQSVSITSNFGVKLPYIVSDRVSNIVSSDTWADILAVRDLTATAWKDKPYAMEISIPACVAGETLATVNGGADDASYTSIANALFTLGNLGRNPNTTGKPTNCYIRIGWEFTGNWVPWHITNPTGTINPTLATNFAAVYRRIVGLFRAVSPNFKFVWNWAYGPSVDPTTAYPGDDVVDVIGFDAYNQQYGLVNPDGPTRWNQILTAVDGLNFCSTFATTHLKPIAFSEWATGFKTDGMGGGDDPYFIHQMFLWQNSHNVLYSIYDDYSSGTSTADYQGSIDPNWTLSTDQTVIPYIIQKPATYSQWLQDFGGLSVWSSVPKAIFSQHDGLQAVTTTPVVTVASLVGFFAPASDDLAAVGLPPLIYGLVIPASDSADITTQAPIMTLNPLIGGATITPPAGVLWDGILTNWKPKPLIGNAYNIGCFNSGGSASRFAQFMAMTNSNPATGWAQKEPFVMSQFSPQDTWANIQSAVGSAAASYKNRRHAFEICIPNCTSTQPFSYTNAGSADVAIKACATSLLNNGFGAIPNSTGRNINCYVRIGWEMTGGWFPWNTVTGGVMDSTKATAYKSAFQRIVNIFRTVSPNFRFIWCYAWGVGLDPTLAYPGDAYVDFVGVDAYGNYYNVDGGLPLNSTNLWNGTLTHPGGLNFLANFSATHNKAIVMSEWTSGYHPFDQKSGDDGDAPYIENMFNWLNAHNVAYTLYWDYPASDMCGTIDPNWMIYPWNFARAYTYYTTADKTAGTIPAGKQVGDVKSFSGSNSNLLVGKNKTYETWLRTFGGLGQWGVNPMCIWGNPASTHAWFPPESMNTTKLRLTGSVPIVTP